MSFLSCPSPDTPYDCISIHPTPDLTDLKEPIFQPITTKSVRLSLLVDPCGRSPCKQGVCRVIASAQGQNVCCQCFQGFFGKKCDIPDLDGEGRGKKAGGKRGGGGGGELSAPAEEATIGSSADNMASVYVADPCNPNPCKPLSGRKLLLLD